MSTTFRKRVMYFQDLEIPDGFRCDWCADEVKGLYLPPMWHSVVDGRHPEDRLTRHMCEKCSKQRL